MFQFNILLAMIILLAGCALFGLREAALILALASFALVLWVKALTKKAIEELGEQSNNGESIAWWVVQATRWKEQGKVLRIIEGTKEDPETIVVGSTSPRLSGKGSHFHPEVRIGRSFAELLVEEGDDE